MQVGVRELKTRTSEILRQVRDSGARCVITSRGLPIAVLIPFGTCAPEEDSRPDAWQELERLGEEIAEEWASPLSSGELLSQTRR